MTNPTPPEWATVPHDDIVAGVEVRLNDDATIDEVVIPAATAFHLEQMDDDQFWIGIDVGGETQHVMLTAKKGKLYATVYT